MYEICKLDASGNIKPLEDANCHYKSYAPNLVRNELCSWISKWLVITSWIWSLELINSIGIYLARTCSLIIVTINCYMFGSYMKDWVWCKCGQLLDYHSPFSFDQYFQTSTDNVTMFPV